MVDIAFIAFLAWRVGVVARANGRDPIGYRWAVGVTAVVGEITALVWGLIACHGKVDVFFAPLILAALVGIAVGAAPAFLLLAVLPPRPCPGPSCLLRSPSSGSAASVCRDAPAERSVQALRSRVAANRTASAGPSHAARKNENSNPR